MSLNELGLYKTTKKSIYGEMVEGYTCEAVSASPNNNLPEPFYMPAEFLPEDGWEKVSAEEKIYPSGTNKKTVYTNKYTHIKLKVQSGSFFGPKVTLI